ncbi:MAG: NADH:flavin oxidoreductase, partial [Erysipelotrichaceae bacterium]
MSERILFTPLKIGSMNLVNRSFMAPMSLGYESDDGSISPKLQTYWLKRAQGGVGCIITDALSVDPRMPYLGNTLFLSENNLKSYESFIEKIHKTGAKIIPQITHPGPESVIAFHGIAPLASSCYINSMGQKTRALTLAEIPGIIAMYANTSYLAKLAGFDGIELHCAHAYMLLGSFLSPMRNKRTDEYGGSLDHRARLLFEVIDAIKEKCGKDFPIVLRMSGSEKDPQGNTLEDMLYLIPQLIQHGIDAFEVSGGTQYEHPNKIIPCDGEVEGLNVPQAKAIKACSSVPVIVVGKIMDPKYAEYLLDSKQVDGIVFGRALLADSDYIKKCECKDYDDIAP